MKKLVRKLFNKLGYNIVPLHVSVAPKPARNILAMESMLERCSKHGLNFTTVIDVGASTGLWAEQCIVVYPDAFYFMIEAQDVHLEGLKKFRQKHPKSEFVIAAAGARRGKIYFDATDPYSGLASETQVGEKCITVDVTTIDSEVSERKLEGPFLIKLDTHGFEVPILEGAAETLKQAEGVIIEVYNFQIASNSLLFYEMCDYMNKLGFRPIDIADPLFRLHDSSFWQMDILFIRKDRKEFAYLEYK